MDLRLLRVLPLVAVFVASPSIVAGLAAPTATPASPAADPATEAEAPAVESLSEADTGSEDEAGESKEGDRVEGEGEDPPEVTMPVPEDADAVEVVTEHPPEGETALPAETPHAGPAPTDGPPDVAPPAETPPASGPAARHASPPGHGPLLAPPPDTAPSPGDRRPPPPGGPAGPPPEGEAKRPPPRLGRASPQAPAMPTDGDQAAVGLPTLAALSKTRDRPLFVPGRRGVQPAPTRPIRIEPKEEPEAPPPPLTLALRGVVTGPGVAMAMLADPADDKITRMKIDDEHDGWRLTAIDRVSVTFRRGDEEQVLHLPPPGTGEPGKARTPTKPQDDPL